LVSISFSFSIVDLTSYSMVSVYLLYPWGHKVCAHEEVPFLIDYRVS
jgi:hypothetical protein